MSNSRVGRHIKVYRVHLVKKREPNSQL